VTKETEFLKQIETNKGILIKISRIYARNAQDQNDLKQEIIFRLWKSFDTFQGKCKFSTWMYRVALNTAITFLKNEKKKTAESLVEPCDAVPTRNADTGESRLELFYQAVQLLNPIEKAIIFLFLEGMNHRQIAERMGISEGNARVKLSRTKAKLRSILKEPDHGF